MKVAQLLKELEKLNSDDPFIIDGWKSTYISIKFDYNYVGTVRSIKSSKSRYGDTILSPVAVDDYFSSLDPEDIMTMLKLADPDSNVVYNTPSMGAYDILELKRCKGNWGDGDGPYDYVNIICTEEPITDKIEESQVRSLDKKQLLDPKEIAEEIKDYFKPGVIHEISELEMNDDGSLYISYELTWELYKRLKDFSDKHNISWQSQLRYTENYYADIVQKKCSSLVNEGSMDFSNVEIDLNISDTIQILDIHLFNEGGF